MTKPRAIASPVRVAGEHHVLRQAEAGHGAVADALLRHEGRAEPAAGVDAAPADRLAVDQRSCRRAATRALAGERGEELLLAVAGDAGDADDLAAHARSDRCRRAAWRTDCRPAATACSAPAAACARRSGRRGRSMPATSAPTIMRARLLALSAFGSAVATSLPRRRIVARLGERQHLGEPVRDVEDGDALGGEPPQRDEEQIGLLRRQHRGRLVHDDEPRLLQQAAHDLDALPLADREIGDAGVRDRAAGRIRATRCGSSRRARGGRAAAAPARCSPRRSAPRTAKNAGTPCRCRGGAPPPGCAIATGWPSQRMRPSSGASAP